MFRAPACTGGWVLRNALILLDVHNDVEKCDKKKKKRDRERSIEAVIEPPNSAHPVATPEILMALEGGSRSSYCPDNGYSRIRNNTCYFSSESASPSSPFISHHSSPDVNV